MDIKKANEGLRAGGCRVVVEERGGWLWLRGTLPPKPGSEKKAHQQRIRLGVRASVAGLEQAKREARRVTVLLDRKEFDWSLFGVEEGSTVVAVLVKELEREYWLTHERNPTSESTWRGDYLGIFSRLPQDVPLTAGVMLDLIETTKPNSALRRKMCMVLGKLCQLGGIPFDPKMYRGQYQPRERNIPTDDQILAAYHLLKGKNIPWSNALLLIAAYGLRAHEVFFLDRERWPILRVTEGKTGDRPIYPYPQSWLEENNLTSHSVLPERGKAKTFKHIGQRVNKYFLRHGLPFRPYDLRHAHAIRMISYRVPVEIAARYHGHSVQVHTNIYQRWMSQQTLDQTWLETKEFG